MTVEVAIVGRIVVFHHPHPAPATPVAVAVVILARHGGLLVAIIGMLLRQRCDRSETEDSDNKGRAIIPMMFPATLLVPPFPAAFLSGRRQSRRGNERENGRRHDRELYKRIHDCLLDNVITRIIELPSHNTHIISICQVPYLRCIMMTTYAITL